MSTTGDGEYFMRLGVAHEIAARITHAGQTVDKASGDVVAELARMGGSGGLIAMDATGRVAMPFSARGMYRGTIDSDGHGFTAFYRGEPSPLSMAA